MSFGKMSTALWAAVFCLLLTSTIENQSSLKQAWAQGDDGDSLDSPLEGHRDLCGEQCVSTYMPVCGTDGNTYENECDLRKRACTLLEADIAVAYVGSCEGEAESEGIEDGITTSKSVYEESLYDVEAEGSEGETEASSTTLPSLMKKAAARQLQHHGNYHNVCCSECRSVTTSQNAYFDCMATCKQFNCVAESTCERAAAGAYAAYCQSVCRTQQLSTVSDPLVTPATCTGICVSGVQHMCNNECREYDCVVNASRCRNGAAARCHHGL